MKMSRFIPQRFRASADQSPQAFTVSSAVTVRAAEGSETKGTFEIEAYNGGAMRVAGFFHPIVLDLDGVKASRKNIPILVEHDPMRIVGQTSEIDVSEKGVRLKGKFTGDDNDIDTRKVVSHARNGFEWQASVGGSVDRREFIEAGKTGEANGQTFTGPIFIARESTLSETSFVAIGADQTTSARVAATNVNGDQIMNFSEWLAAKGIDASEISEAARKQLEVSYNAEVKASDAPGSPLDSAVGGTDVSKQNSKPGEAEAASLPLDAAGQAAEAVRAASAAEMSRIQSIQSICADKGSPKIKVGDNDVDLAAHAVSEGWDQTRTELEALKAATPSAPAGFVVNAPRLTGNVLEAAACLAAGISRPEDHYKEEVLEAADSRYHGRIGLQELVVEAAQANGYSGYSFTRDPEGVLRAAFGQNLQASGFSTFSISGVLSNIANKFLLQGFNAVEQAWRDIAAIRNVSDFKQVTSYRLTGGFEYEQVGPGGQLKHGTIGEQAYTNQADTYGKMFGITRKDLINDDLNALSAVPNRIGRGGGLKLNDVFWKEFLDNSAFFASGNNNYFEGASSALGIDSLTTAETTFMDQVDPDGKPLSIMPEILLVPNGLYVTGSTIENATQLRDTTSGRKTPTDNPHRGKFRTVRSSYLSNATYTGSSTAAWYLLANPATMPTIEVAFLNGKQTPTVESADADFNTLGIQMRGYHDFGASKQEFRGGVKSKGAA